MTPTQISELKKLGIRVLGDQPGIVKIGVAGRRVPLTLESPMQFRRGEFDVESIGAYSYLGGGSAILRHVGRIGRYCSIAGNVVTGSIEHPTDFLSTHPMFYGRWQDVWPSTSSFYDEYEHLRESSRAYSESVGSRGTRIEIGNDVWIGEGVFISRGVRIGCGSIVAARSVVTKDVPPYAIVGGIPARVIRYRFSEEIISKLIEIKWWDLDISVLAKLRHSSIYESINQLEKDNSLGQHETMKPTTIRIEVDGAISVVRHAEKPTPINKQC